MDILLALGALMLIVGALLLLKLGKRTPSNLTGGPDRREETDE